MAAVSDLGVMAFMFEMLDEKEQAMEIELKYLASYSIFSEPKKKKKPLANGIQYQKFEYTKMF